MDCSPPRSSVHEILQVRILECVAWPFSRGSSWPRAWTCISLYFWHCKRVLYHSDLLGMIISRFIYVAVIFCSFYSWVAFLPLYICTTTSISIHPSVNMLFVSKPWLLWLVLLWTYRCMCLFELEFFLEYMPRSGMLGAVVVLFLVFWGISILFSVVAVLTYRLVNTVRGFCFLHISLKFVISCIFNDGHLSD